MTEKTADGRFYRRMGRVERTMLGVDMETMALTASLLLDFGAAKQWVGGVTLAVHNPTAPDGFTHKLDASMFILGVLRAFAAWEWERVKGRVIFALYDHPDCGTAVGLAPLDSENGSRFLFSELRSLQRAPKPVEPPYEPAVE